MKLCTVCGAIPVARGLCKKHYRAFMKYGNPNASANMRGVPFEYHYQEIGECWMWIGSTNADGYGTWYAHGEQKAHRASWVLHNKRPIPDGLHVLHTCDNPGCVRPMHLVLGTHQDNMADLRAKGRAYGAKGEANFGAKINEAQALAIMNDPRPAADIARQYGLSTATVSNIRVGKTWSHLFDPSFRAARDTRLSIAQKTAILTAPRTQVQIAKAYGVSQSSVSVIKRTFKP